MVECFACGKKLGIWGWMNSSQFNDKNFCAACVKDKNFCGENAKNGQEESNKGITCYKCGKELKFFNRKIHYTVKNPDSVFEKDVVYCPECHNKEEEKLKAKRAPIEKARQLIKSHFETEQERSPYFYSSEKNSNPRYFVETGYFDEEEIINSLIENNFDINKTINLLVEKRKKENREWQIEREMDKIKDREKKHLLREEAEKRYYSKVKTKRQAFTTDEKEAILGKFNNECAVCGRTEGLHIHHKDHNANNNQISNLIVLCGVCHKKVHMKVR